MRILFFSHYFHPEGNAPASRTYENCRRWVEAGHEVTVITGVPNVPSGVIYPGYVNRLRQEEMVDGIRVIRVWTLLAANRGTFRRILNFLTYALTSVLFNLRLPRPNVVIATSPQFFCGWAGLLWAKIRRVPCVLEIRDIWPESITAVGAIGEGPLIRTLKWLERALYRLSDHIVCVGNGYRDNLMQKGVLPEKISVVTNGADLEFFQPGTRDDGILRKHQLHDRFTIAYVGTIGMACGLDVVLNAAERLQGEADTTISFLLVGDGAARERLQKEKGRRGLNNVIFTGRVDKESVPRYLQSCDLVLVHLIDMPLFQTVLPSKIFEAMACGKPVLLGVRGEAKALLEKAKAGVAITPENADELVAVIRRLQGDPDLLLDYSRSARQFVEQHFDRTRLAADYLKILERINE